MTKAAVEGQLTFLAAHRDEVKRHLRQAEAQLPVEGHVVNKNFMKLAAEVGSMKRTKSETFTKQICAELKLMRQYVVAHEHHRQ